jgi:hypothetical protein
MIIGVGFNMIDRAKWVVSIQSVTQDVADMLSINAKIWTYL